MRERQEFGFWLFTLLLSLRDQAPDRLVRVGFLMRNEVDVRMVAGSRSLGCFNFKH
jgi:hypothetical protein